MNPLVLLATLGLVLAPVLALTPAASATTCNAIVPFLQSGNPADLVSGVRCLVASEVCLFTNALRPGWCPV